MIGEPVRSALASAELTKAADLAGWSMLSDSGLQDWQRELTPTLTLAEGSPWLQWHERIWIGQAGWPA